MKVIKVKIKDSLPIITYMKEHEDGKSSEVQETGPYLLHEDFQNAMNRLRPHLATLCDLRESDTIEDIENCHEENFSYIHVTGFTISGEGENEGVCLIGNKKIGKKVLNLTAPFQKYEDEFEPYRYKSDLIECIHAVQFEATEYIEGKHAIKQLEMEFEVHAEDMD